MDTPVTVEDSGRANLLELMLASLLQRRLADPHAREHARALDGPVVVEAGAMRATLTFRAGQVAISRGGGGGARGATKVRGSLAAIVDAALGRRRFAHVLRGELRASGRPRALWHLLALLRPEGAR